MRTDNGGKYCSKNFIDYLHPEGIKHKFTIPYTPEQNVASERDNYTIVEAIRSSIYHSHLDLALWAEAVDNIVYTLNRTCS